MKINFKKSEQSFIIYRERQGVLTYSIIMFLACLLMGSGFAYYIAPESGYTVFRYFGYGFIFFGFLILVNIIRVLIKSKKAEGPEVMSLSKSELHLCPGLGLAPSIYQWSQIRKVMIVNILKHKDSDGATESSRQIVFLFDPSTIEDNYMLNTKNFRFKNINDELYTNIPYPKALNQDVLLSELRIFAPEHLEIETHDKFNLC